MIEKDRPEILFTPYKQKHIYIYIFIYDITETQFHNSGNVALKQKNQIQFQRIQKENESIIELNCN